MEPSDVIPCSGRCLIHLHSEAGSAWLMRHSCPYPQRLGSDGISYFLAQLGNDEPSYVPAHVIHTFSLRLMIAKFECQSGRRVQNIAVIIPATHNPDEYQSQIYAAAAAAEVRILDIVERSLLAAFAYKSIDSTGRITVLVFDLGGPILEISMFDENGGLNKMAAVFDLGCPLFNHMISEIPSNLGDIDFTRDADFLRHIHTECELAKDFLCLGLDTVQIKIQRHGLEMRKLIDRESLVQLNLNHLRSAIRRCFTEAGVGREAVDKVVLVGASCTIPEVRSVLLGFFQTQSIRDSVNPEFFFCFVINEYQNSFSSTEHIPRLEVTGLETYNLGLYSL